MLSIRHVISKSSCPCISHLVIVPRAPITIGITPTFMFHSFFQFPRKILYLSFFSLSFNFTHWSAGTAKSTILQALFFVDYYKVWSSGRLTVIRCSVCNLKSQWSLFVSIFWNDAWLCVCHWFVWSTFNFHHDSQRITLPTKSCL